MQIISSQVNVTLREAVFFDITLGGGAVGAVELTIIIIISAKPKFRNDSLAIPVPVYLH